MSDAAPAPVSGSSFYAAMRILPPPERAAMFAVYEFCRRVDDIADDPGPSRADRQTALDGWRSDLETIYAGRKRGKAAFLEPAIARFHLAKADFLAVIDGMAMDVEADIQAPSFEALDLYCDRVASAVGRLSVRIFGMEDAPGIVLAHHLGRALQFTNILRDLDEDAAIHRLYLPEEALAAAGVASREPGAVILDPGLDGACRWLADKALGHYAAADRVMRQARRGRLRAPRLMGAVYGHILRRMMAAGWAAPRARVKVGKARLAWIVLTRGLTD